MKAVVLNGSPRINGNTNHLLKYFIDGFKAAAGEIEIINTVNINIRPCNGCLKCEETGTCIIRDYMDEIYSKVDQADVIVLSSPVYFASFSAQLKTVIDRFQANFSRKYILRHKDDRKRKGYLIFTAGGKNEKMILSMELGAKFFFLSCNASLEGMLYALGTDSETVFSMDELLQRAYQTGYDAALGEEK